MVVDSPEKKYRTLRANPASQYIIENVRFVVFFFKFWVFYFLITSQKFNVFYQFRYFLSFRLVVVFWISSVQLVGIGGLSISAVLWLVRIWGHEVPVISLCTAWFRTQFCPWFFRHDLKSQIDRYKNVCVSKTFAEKLWLITQLITHQ